MVRRLRGKQGVYLITPPADWKPQRLWDWPPTFTSGQLVARNLTPANAAGYCRTHNKQAMESVLQNEPIATWALYVRHVRPHWRNRTIKQGKVQGGVA